jgi:hypothetical protein
MQKDQTELWIGIYSIIFSVGARCAALDCKLTQLIVWTSKKSVFWRIRRLIRSVAFTFGTRFDSCADVLESLASATSPNTWTIQDEEDRARILFDLALLLARREHARRKEKTFDRRGDHTALSPTATGQKSITQNVVASYVLRYGWKSNANWNAVDRAARIVVLERRTTTKALVQALSRLQQCITVLFCPDVMWCLLFTEGPESDAILA